MKKYLVMVIAVMAITGLMVLPAFAGNPKLVVKDSTGNNTVFEVDDAGAAYINSSQAHAQLFLSAASDQVANGGQKPMVIFKRSRGSFGATTAVQNGDSLGQFLMSGATGANTFDATRRIFEVLATENWTPTAGGYEFAFYTRPNGSMSTPQLVTSFTQDRKLVMWNGAYSDGAAWYPGSSREYKENIQDLSAARALDAVRNLNPVTYNYKAIPEQKHVGFIAEDVPDLVALNGRKALSPLDIIAVLTKVVQEQDKTIAELSKKLNNLESQVARIKSRDVYGSVDTSVTSGK